ncbi:TRAP transporter small permease [Kineococcus sp. SYSU DK004]|uniref:TRAP transporter small permease n=1 Tax=Kineococcus sp. SYSU DK004 TaxID=3383125 RepID=UPI003D7E7450
MAAAPAGGRRNPLARVFDLADRALLALCVLLLAVIAGTVTWQVLARYVVETPSAWAAEAATLSFVWLALFAIALGVRRGRHMVLDIWEYLPVPRWVRVVVDTVAAVVVCGTLAALTWYGFQGLETSFRRTMPGLGISFGWNALAVPVGLGLSLLFAVEAWWVTVRAPRSPGAAVASEDVTDEPAPRPNPQAPQNQKNPPNPSNQER